MMGQTRFNSLALALALVAASGMALAQPQPGAIVGRTPLAQTNADSLARDYGIEREGRREPKVGLALAGGGTRAGYFAHGVLQGLNDTGLLERVDAISSVSGGSYAAYWYFSKGLEARRLGFSPSQIFADCLPMWWVEARKGKTDGTSLTLQALMAQARDKGSPKMPACDNSLHWEPGDPYRWQAHLARWPDMFRRTPIFVSGDAQGAPVWEVASEVPAFLVELPLSLSKAIKTSNIPLEYHYGIERVWGLNPEPRVFDRTPAIRDDKRTKWAYTNAVGQLGSRDLHVDPVRGGWEALRTQYSNDKTLPLWILNSTQGQKGAAPDSRHIYEMTPLSHGAAGHGYRIESPQRAGVEDLGRATLASAAFADRQGVAKPFWGTAMGLHKALTWGIDIEDRFSPAPAKPLHLSDGGGSENLGLYSLLKRRIPDIIVVDDASDQIGRMDDLCWVRAAVARDVPGSAMTFPALKDFATLCETWEAADKDERKLRNTLVYNTSAWLNPVVKGQVTWPDVNGQKIPPTRLWLVKLGWHQQDFRRAFNAGDCGSPEHPVNCLLTTYYGHNTATVNNKDGYMEFPHLSTPGATYNASSYLFWAYRELGRMVSSELEWTEAGGGGLALRSGKPQCSQQAMAFKGKGRRPQHKPASAGAEAGCVAVLP